MTEGELLLISQLDSTMASDQVITPQLVHRQPITPTKSDKTYFSSLKKKLLLSFILGFRLSPQGSVTTEGFPNDLQVGSRKSSISMHIVTRTHTRTYTHTYHGICRDNWGRAPYLSTLQPLRHALCLCSNIKRSDTRCRLCVCWEEKERDEEEDSK